MRNYLAIAAAVAAAAAATPGLAAPVTLGPFAATDGAVSARVEIDSGDLVLNRLVACEVLLLDRHGHPVEGARISVDAGVPRLGRRMPTAPRVVREAPGGRYRIDGLRFDMAGKWRIELAVEAGGRKDKVNVEVDVR